MENRSFVVSDEKQNYLNQTFTQERESYTERNFGQSSPSRPKFPAKIWGRILKLEKEIEQNTISIEQIGELVTLYSQAVEFFDDTNNQAQFNHYKKKIADLHKRPSIIQVMSDASDQQNQKYLEEKKTQQLNPQTPSSQFSKSKSSANLGSTTGGQFMFHKNKNSLKQDVAQQNSKTSGATTNNEAERAPITIEQKKKNFQEQILVTKDDLQNFFETEERELEKSIILMDDELEKQKQVMQERIKNRRNKQLQNRIPTSPDCNSLGGKFFKMDSQKLLRQSSSQYLTTTPRTDKDYDKNQINPQEINLLDRFIQLLIQDKSDEFVKQSHKKINDLEEDYQLRLEILKNSTQDNEEETKQMVEHVINEKIKKLTQLRKQLKDEEKRQIQEFSNYLEKKKLDLEKSVLSDISDQIHLQTELENIPDDEVMYIDSSYNNESMQHSNHQHSQQSNNHINVNKFTE